MFRPALALDDLWSGDMQACNLDGTPIVLVRFGNQVLAYEDRCPHFGTPLSRGTLAGTTLTCAGHHWQFDASTGCGINPRIARLRSFAVKIDKETIYVDVAALSGPPRESRA